MPNSKRKLAKTKNQLDKLAATLVSASKQIKHQREKFCRKVVEIPDEQQPTKEEPEPPETEETLLSEQEEDLPPKSIRPMDLDDESSEEEGSGSDDEWESPQGNFEIIPTKKETILGLLTYHMIKFPQKTKECLKVDLETWNALRYPEPKVTWHEFEKELATINLGEKFYNACTQCGITTDENSSSCLEEICKDMPLTPYLTVGIEHQLQNMLQGKVFIAYLHRN